MADRRSLDHVCAVLRRPDRRPDPLFILQVYRAVGMESSMAALLAFASMAGTCLWPVAAYCAIGWLYSIQHVTSQIGLAMILIGMLGRPRRYWLAGCGVLIAAWSRQTCLLYAAPVLWWAWKDRRLHSTTLISAGLPILIATAGFMALNAAKFGNPLQSGLCLYIR